MEKIKRTKKTNYDQRSTQPFKNPLQNVKVYLEDAIFLGLEVSLKR